MRCLEGLIVALGLALPVHADVTSELASQIRADVAVLSSDATLAEWQRSHPGAKVELARYEIEERPYEFDFYRVSRWCAASVADLQPQTVRSAVFYVPSASQGALPPLPAGPTTRECRLQEIWYETSAGASLDALVNELSSLWGRPNGQTATPDIPGSPLWRGAVAWHRKGINIWAVHDPELTPRRAGAARLIVYGRRDTPRDQFVFNIGPLGNRITNQVTDIAAQMAAQDPALTAAVLDRSKCFATPPKRESNSLTVSRLTKWLKASADAPPGRRAAALLVADAYVRCAAQLRIEDLTALGAEVGPGCPQDGPAYDGNFLRKAEKLDPEGPASKLAALASLSNPCSLKGRGLWPDLAIEKGERLLSEFPADQWTPLIHFALAGAHAAKLSFAYPEGDPDNGIDPLPSAAMRQQRRQAIQQFEEFIREKPDSPEAVFAWQESWRLLAGLPPSHVGFGCGCE